MDGSPTLHKGAVRRAAGWLLCTVLFLIPLGYMLLSLGIFRLLAGNSYDNLLALYSKTSPQAFDTYTIAVQSFTPAWHEWIGTHRLAGFVLLAAMPVLYLAFSRSIWRFFRRLVGELWRGLVFLAGGLKGCSGAEKGAFFLLTAGVLAYRLYFYVANPLQTDEVCSYLYFVRPGLFISLTSYPIPNNHVFFNGCCALLNLIPGLSVKAVMRLPSILGDLFLLYSIFCLVRRWDGYWRAMISVAAIAFCYVTSYYAVQGRGYQWQEVCALVSAVSCWECFFGAGRRERRGYTLFIAGVVVGLYINPVFVYHLTALGLAYLWHCWREKDRAGFLFFVRCVGIMAGWLAVLYMPLILSSSWGALMANDYVTGGSYAILFAHIRNGAYIVKDFIHWDIPGVFFMVVCAVGLFVAYRKKIIVGMFYDNMFLYLVALVVSLTGWTLYKKIYPVERGLCYVVPAINLVFIKGCYDLLFKWRLVRRYYVSLALGLLLVVKIGGSVRGLYRDQSGLEHRIDTRIVRGVEKDIRELDGLHPTTWQRTTSDDFYPMYVQEYLIRKGREKEVFFSRTVVGGDVIFMPEGLNMPLPLDVLGKRYVLWADDKPTSYGPRMRIYVTRSLVDR